MKHLDFASPVKSLRLLALEEAARHGDSTDVLRQLQGRQEVESDPECRLLLVQAIESVQRRLRTGGGRGSGTPGFDPGGFVTSFAAADAGGRLALLAQIPPRSLADLACHAPGWFDRETTPVVAATLLRTFARHWPTAQIDRLLARLRDPSPVVRAAVLEVMIQLAPFTLVRDLPTLVADEDPRVRAVAIGGLARIDVEEALAHVEQVLLSGDRPRQQAMLASALAIPFDRMKPILLKFLASQEDPELLRQAGLIAAINPDLEMPFRVWEISEQAGPEKAEVLKAIMQDAGRVIERSGILGERFPEYLARLKTWLGRRTATRFVHDCIAHLRIAGNPATPGVWQRLQQGIQRQEIRDALADALTWPLPAQLRNELRQLLDLGLVPDAASGDAPTGATTCEPARTRPARRGTAAATPVIGTPRQPSDRQPPVESPAQAGFQAGGATPSTSTPPGLSTTAAPGDPSKDSPQAFESRHSTTPGDRSVAALSDADDILTWPGGDATVDNAALPTDQPPVTTEVRDGGLRPPAPTALSGPPTPGPVDPPIPTARSTTGPRDDAGEADRLRRLALFRASDRGPATPEIRSIIESPTPSGPLLAAALRAAARLGLRGFAGRAAALCADEHTDGVVSAAALEYLARFDGLAFREHLRRLLLSGPGGRLTMNVRLLRLLDPTEAVALIKDLLGSDQTVVRQRGLAAAVHLDFPLVREIMADFLGSSTVTADELSAGLCLFQANPDSENLYYLYRIEQTLPLEHGRQAKRVRSLLGQTLAALGQISPADLQRLETSLPTRWNAELARRQSPPPPYAARRPLVTPRPLAQTAEAGDESPGLVSRLLGLWRDDNT